MKRNRWVRILSVATFAAISLAASVASAANIGYVQTNLVSDIPGLAANTDPNLRNPWGISYSATSPFWVSNQVTGNATLYNAAGVPQPMPTPLVVTIPGGNPTGQAFVGGLGFVTTVGGTATFVFATRNGFIAAWNGAMGTSASVVVALPGAVYTGLAVAGTAPNARIYAANASENKIDVFDQNFFHLSLPGGFSDPNIPSGFTPYNIENIAGNLYVEYASQSTPGGFVAVFDTNGNLVQHFSNPHLNAPWGVTLAPAGFGDFANALLVGNFADGRINAFNPANFAFLGTISDPLGNPIENPGLWDLGFRASGSGIDTNTLFFTAGINGEQDGLFGAIRSADASTPGVVPEPATLGLLGIGLVRFARRKRSQ